MCYARKPVIRTKAAEYPNLMTSTPDANELKKKAYATAYTKTKEIMRKLFHTDRKDEQAPAV
jgi:hypothetical protein